MIDSFSDEALKSIGFAYKDVYPNEIEGSDFNEKDFLLIAIAGLRDVLKSEA